MARTVKTKTGKVYSEEGLIKRTKRRLYELWHGKKAYAKKKVKKTVRTKDVEGGLKRAGLTAKEIARLRGKK